MIRISGSGSNKSQTSLSRRASRLIASAVMIVCLCCAFSACSNRGSEEARSNCLSDVNLVDQNGKSISLASLRGKPLLVDFIYTSCPGPCLMETAKLTNVALRLGKDLGSKVALVSISVDPEHDGPKQLLEYARQQGADTPGWYFLTGGPADIDRALAGFKMQREKEPDGSVGHIVDMLLIDSSGAQVHEYNAQVVKAQDLAKDLIGLARG